MEALTDVDLINKVFNFCENLTGMTLYPYQAKFGKRVIRSVLTGEGEEITALFSRQCIPGDQIVYMADGSYKLIKDVLPGDKILSVNTTTDTVEEDVIKDRWETGVRPRLRIKTIRGFTIECSPKHLFYTPQGWREAGNLKPRTVFKEERKGAKDGHRDTLDGEVLVRRHQTYCGSVANGVFGDTSIGQRKAAILGYLITDGYYGAKGDTKFTNITDGYLTEFKSLVKKTFNITLKECEKGKGLDLLFSKAADPNRKFNTWLKELGIYGQVRNEKRIPDCMFKCSKEELAVFVNRMFAAHGWISNKASKGKENTEIGIGFQSLEMTKQLRFILHKFGIGSRIEESNCGPKQVEPFWKLRIGRSTDIITFLDSFGDIKGKEKQSQSARKLSSKERRYRQNRFYEDISWDVISSIESLPNCPMYDLETEINHNFICEGFVVHNSGKSEALAVVMCGMAVILPILANTPAFYGDKRLTPFRDSGFMLGIFAPSERQSKIIFNRIKGYLTKPRAAEVFTDPEFNISFSTNNGQNFVLRFNNTTGVSSLIACTTASENANIEGDSYMVIVCDEAQDISDFKYKKSITPMGSFYNATRVLIGTATITKGFFFESIELNKYDYANKIRKQCHFEYDWTVAAQYNENYRKYVEGQKKKYGERSDEFLMSFCLQWMLQRGMFVTMEKLEQLGDSNIEVSLSDRSRKHVAGIDLGKENDSTVITILEVDWENPIDPEPSEDPNVPDYAIYDTKVKAWLEINGDDWNEQYAQILDFLSNFLLARVCVDSTGVGSHMFDRLSAVLSQQGIECIPYAFSTQSKSLLFKFFDSQIKSDRFHYPAGPYTRESLEYRNFIQQMAEAEKSYSGPHMKVAAPARRGAHDDHVCSSALAVWASRGEAVYGGTRPEFVRDNIFFKCGGSVSAFYRSRNALTAGRR